MLYLSQTEYQNKSGVLLIFCEPCIVTYLPNKNQQDALFYSQIISVINLYMFWAEMYLLLMSSKPAWNM
jgi:hypothetical protein